jgi:putative phosphoribosyl transferase
MIFANRREAGTLLAQRLEKYAKRNDVIVLGLPHGGVAVGYHIAKALKAPLDMLFVKKIGEPECNELAMGAIASAGGPAMHQGVVLRLGLSEQEIGLIANHEQKELKNREDLHRHGRPAPVLKGKTVILVDDGLATGCSMQVAVKAVRTQKATRIVVAVPVGPRSVCDELAREADEVVCLTTPKSVRGIGRWYADYKRIDDKQVGNLLARAARSINKEAA